MGRGRYPETKDQEKNRAVRLKKEKVSVVVLDTSIIIDHLRLPPGKDTHLKRAVRSEGKENLAIAMITVQELYEGKSTKDTQKEEYFLATISPLRLLPYTYEVAQLAGEIARDLSGPIQLADAAIAATAIVNGAELFTLDQNGFRGIKELELYDDSK